MKRFSSAIAAFSLSILPFIAVAQQQGSYSTRTFAGLVRLIVSYINPIIGILVSLTVLVFLYNMMRYVWTAGDSHEHGEAMRGIGWSLLGLLVLFGVWGILSILSTTLFGAALIGEVNPCRVDPGSSFVAC